MKRTVPSPQKLIAFLQGEVKEQYSAKSLKRMLEANLCRVNERIERFGSRRVERGDIVELSLSRALKEKQKTAKTFPILYEDEEIRAIDKPSGWVCSPQNMLSTFGKGLELIHRLDKDTTGVLLLAKQKEAFTRWSKFFSERKISKQYLAIVDGVPKEDRGTKESYLSRKKVFQGQTIWGSSTQGLYAKTHWRVLARGEQSSLIACQPVTGRTHQIRVHLAEIGHPILIDRQYSARFRSNLSITRPLLHAFQIEAASLLIKAPIPIDMQEAFLALKIDDALSCKTDLLNLF